MMNKVLDENDIYGILKTNVLFVMPKFYKNNLLKNNKQRNIIKKYIEKLSYSIITNYREKYDYKKRNPDFGV